MRPLLIAALLLLASPARAEEPGEPLEPPPQATGPEKAGVVLELAIGGGACPECAYEDGGLALGGAAGYRFPSGVALAAYFMSLNANDEGSCYYAGYYDDDTCYRDELVILFFGADARYYPFSTTPMSFDPYVGVAIGYGIGASREGGPDLAEYSGWMFLPRLGAMAKMGDLVSIGGSVGRSFALWDKECTTGDDGASYGYYSCGDIGEESPNFWFTSFEVSFRF